MKKLPEEYHKVLVNIRSRVLAKKQRALHQTAMEEEEEEEEEPVQGKRRQVSSRGQVLGTWSTPPGAFSCAQPPCPFLEPPDLGLLCP